MTRRARARKDFNGRMKVGLGLRLREAWRSRFESKSVPQNQVQTVNVYSKDPDQESDAASVKKVNVPAVPSDNGNFGYRDECLTVDMRANRKGEWVLMKGAEQFDPKVDPSKVRKPNSILDPYCMVITRRFNQFGQLESTVLEIQSPGLNHVIRELVTYYSDASFRIGGTIKFEDPPKLLYYYRKELAEYMARPDVDDRTKLHISFALNFLHSHLGEQIKRYEEFLDAGMVKFGNLWMMFKPGCLVYERETEQLFFLQRGERMETGCGEVYNLTCYNIDYNGDRIGKVHRDLAIPGFDNPRTVASLPLLPLDLCENPDGIKQKLLVRAKRFLDLRGIHNLQHPTKGRVMVDAKTFLLRVLPGNEDKKNSQKKGIVIYEDSKCVCAVCKKQAEEKPEDYDHELRQLTENEMLLCSSEVLGFALASHRWILMRIDDLTEILWSADAIDRLVMDKRQKKVLSSLISSPVFTQGVDGDVIGWKGKGLVILLHGQPGTGKTLTAESVCESLKRPLYIVSGGELGAEPEEVEKSLREILELSKLWKAVVLIDEADVFLEARSAHDIVRNNFVSVFLRRLEYFEGILMLTTNRVEQFDEAFISRIHLAMNYPELQPRMRKEIWTNTLRRFTANELAIDVGVDLDEISKVPLNGRVISYAVRTAKAIADEDGSPLKVEHLWDVVSVHQKFDEHLRERKGVGGK